MPYELAIFDFDGTLADSWQLMGRAIIDAADRFGYRRVTPEEAEQLRGQDNRAIMAALDVKMWQLPQIGRHMSRVAREGAKDIRLFDGVDAMLRALPAAGVRVAVVTSNGEDVVRTVLGEELSALVSCFECGASLFGKAARFRRVLRREGVTSARVAAVGDEVRDIEAAASAGMASVAVGWGYATPALLASRSPTHLVHSVSELREVLTAGAAGPA